MNVSVCAVKRFLFINHNNKIHISDIELCKSKKKIIFNFFLLKY